MLVNKMTYSWLSTNGTLWNLRNMDHITRALKHSLATNSPELVIQCNMDLLYFAPVFTGVDLDQVDTSPFPPTPPVQLTPSTPAATPGTSHLPVVPATSTFNYHALPADVLIRYDSFQDPTIIVPAKDLKPFVDPKGASISYYANPFVISTRVILCNGCVLEGDRDQKRFSRDPPVCTDVTPLKLRTRYRNFTNHALSCGYFVVPYYELLSKTHGGSTGFEFGHDLPQSKLTEYFAWQNDIGRVLQNSRMFPPKSTPAQCAATTSNGYKILLAILSDTHPAFVDQPILLAMNFPKQQPNQDIFEFYHLFQDVLRLRVIFMGGTDNMQQDHMIDRPPRRASLFASRPEVAFYPEFFEHQLPCMDVFELTFKKN
jgi:hypothetical protein